MLRRELAVTAPQQPADELVRGVLLDIAGLVNPNLPATRLAPFWDFLASQPGYNALSESTRDWFALHRATGLRDVHSMATLANRLIETSPKEKLSVKEAGYLLAAGLTAYLAMGDQEKANALLDAFNDHQKPINQPPFHLQLLLRQLASKKPNPS